MGSGDKQGLLALAAEDIEWIIPGEDWPLAGTHRGHAELADVLRKASKDDGNVIPKPPEFVAQGDRVLVVGVATGKIKATNKPFEDHWVFAITVRNGKVTKIREYIDTQALARASEITPPAAASQPKGDPYVRPIQAIRVDPVRTSRCGLHRHRRLPRRRRLDPSLLRHRGTRRTGLQLRAGRSRPLQERSGRPHADACEGAGPRERRSRLGGPRGDAGGHATSRCPVAASFLPRSPHRADPGQRARRRPGSIELSTSG